MFENWRENRAVREADYSADIALSEAKDKLVMKMGETEKRRTNRMNKYDQSDSSIHMTLTHSSFMY